jgi:hypothetical protein
VVMVVVVCVCVCGGGGGGGIEVTTHVINLLIIPPEWARVQLTPETVPVQIAPAHCASRVLVLASALSEWVSEYPGESPCDT